MKDWKQEEMNAGAQVRTFLFCLRSGPLKDTAHLQDKSVYALKQIYKLSCKMLRHLQDYSKPVHKIITNNYHAHSYD